MLENSVKWEVNRGGIFRDWPVGADEIHPRGNYWATQNDYRVPESMAMRAKDTKIEKGNLEGQGDR